MFDYGKFTFADLAQTGGYGLEPPPAALPAAAAASGRLLFQIHFFFLCTAIRFL
jgi:hypothetical protein